MCQNMNHNFTDSACLHMCLSVCVGHLQIHDSTLLLDCLRSTIDMAAVVLFSFFFISRQVAYTHSQLENFAGVSPPVFTK